MINLIKSSFYEENKTKKKLIKFILNSKIFSMNEQCSLFERKFAKKQNRKYAVFVSSGSMANLVLIQSLLNLGKIKKGDKIAISSLTWATNIMPLIQLGLTPVIIDCELSTLNVSSKNLKSIENENIKAFFLTNVLGFCDDIDEIKKWCDKKNILLLEDNCESLGSKYKNTLLGNFGLASTFSSFVGHHFSTIEGGMICTDDNNLHNMMLMVRAHGWDRNLDTEKQKEIRKENKIDDFFAKYTFYDLAFNARPTEINGFLGNTQINYWDEIVGKRENNFSDFFKKIKENNDFLPLNLNNMDLISNFAMPVVCKNHDLFLKYKNKFEEAEVEIRPIIAGDMTKQVFYKKYIKKNENCPNADFIHKNGFYFPNNPELTKSEVKLLCKLLEK